LLTFAAVSIPTPPLRSKPNSSSELVRDLERDAPRAYATLVLHRYHGLELKEIAPRLGVSYNMVKRYLAQALTFCQQRLAERE